MTSKPPLRKLGIIGLSAIVFGSMVGGGIFALPQNLASAASPGAVIISWVVTAAGMLALVLCLKALADARPDLRAGLYQYALAGYGRLAGFCIAWGYWLCAAFGNVAYAVMLNDSVGAFYPPLLDHGWQAVLFDSVLIWGMYALVINGLRTASLINNIISIIKFASLLLIVAVLVIGFKVGMFTADFWHFTSSTGAGAGLGAQVKNTMLVTLWCFVGIEGAVIMSSRAKRASDVGKAGVIGFLLAWALYVLVSLLCYGVMSQPAMASLPEPSVAYVLREAAGQWAFVFVLLAVIVSLLGGWVAWALICAEVPYQAAEAGIMPGRFMRLNRHGMPAYGMLLSSIVMQGFAMLVMMAPQAYLTALDITTMMVLPAYAFAALFLCKLGFRAKKYLPREQRCHARYFQAVGICCAIYCAWAMYAGGLGLLLETSVFYVSGLAFYFKLQKHRGQSAFTGYEIWALVILTLAAAVSVWLMLSGQSSLI